MRLLLVSDLHYNLPQLDWVVQAAPRFDLVVLAGDCLDVSSPVPLDVQTVVLRRYLGLIGQASRLAVASGNHDLTGPDAHGGQSAPWLADVRSARVACDGDVVDLAGTRVSVYPWWDGPVGRDALAARMAAESAQRPAHDPRRHVLEALAAGPGAASLQFEDQADLALERAEEALLQRLHVDRTPGVQLDLADTTIARGLTADELALLRAELTVHVFAPGQVLFRAGDPGDALYISLRGEIALRLPGTNRRLVSFAPGVTIGDMAVLARAPRSAEAVAESEVNALGLSVETFERLVQQHPQLAARLCRNIAVHLSDRVRMLTGDLAAWMSRADAGRLSSTP